MGDVDIIVPSASSEPSPVLIFNKDRCGTQCYFEKSNVSVRSSTSPCAVTNGVGLRGFSQTSGHAALGSCSRVPYSHPESHIAIRIRGSGAPVVWRCLCSGASEVWRRPVFQDAAPGERLLHHRYRLCMVMVSSTRAFKVCIFLFPTVKKCATCSRVLRIYKKVGVPFNTQQQG